MTCLEEARATAKARKGMWIDRTVRIIQHHNEEIKHERRCRRCLGDAPLLWG